MSRQTPQPPSPARAPSSWRHRRPAWLLGGLLALLVLAELGLRLGLGLGDPLLYRRDADCGYLPAPDQHVRRFLHLNETNAYGMRSPPLREPKPAGETRVLFIGDSVTYGTTYVDQSQIFTSILGRELPGLLHRPVEVLNASAGGWAVDNELGYLRSRGTFHSDLVVFVLNTGDLVQGFAEADLSLAGGMPTARPPCALYELWVRYLRPRLLRRPPAADPGSRPEAGAAAADATLHILDSLSRAKDLAEAAGARFAVVYVPARGPGWDGSANAAREQMLRRWARDHDVPLVDLRDAFSKLPVATVSFDGIHPTPRGHRIVATVLEEHWADLGGPAGAPVSGGGSLPRPDHAVRDVPEH